MLTYTLTWLGGNWLLVLVSGLLALLTWGGAVKARRYLKRKRGQRTATAKRELKRSVAAMRAERAATARGQRRAARRAQRLNLVAGRKRAADDPRLPVRAYRAAKARAATAKANRAAKRLDAPAKPGLLRLLETGQTTPALAAAARPAPAEDRGDWRCQAATLHEQRCRNTSLTDADGYYVGYCQVPNHRWQVTGDQKATG